MDFLKDVLGEDFEVFKEKIESYNQNSETAVKLANLSEGGYVSREKYDALCGQMDKIREESIKPFKDEIDELKSKMSQQEQNFEIDMAIKSSGARNIKAVKALLDLENADVAAVKQQLEILRSENDYLFEKSVGSGVTGMRQGSARRESSAEEELRKKLFGNNK